MSHGEVERSISPHLRRCLAMSHGSVKRLTSLEEMHVRSFCGCLAMSQLHTSPIGVDSLGQVHYLPA